jgi:hypothetical protein
MYSIQESSPGFRAAQVKWKKNICKDPPFFLRLLPSGMEKALPQAKDFSRGKRLSHPLPRVRAYFTQS